MAPFTKSSAHSWIVVDSLYGSQEVGELYCLPFLLNEVSAADGRKRSQVMMKPPVTLIA
jgi:hypothetical protein